jgi:tetratricopeptide (TPR) repeat protein
MSRPFANARWVLLSLSLAIALAVLPASARRGSAEEKETRTQLQRLLDARDFGAALPLAQRLVQLAPKDDGAWDRLVRAQLGFDDVDAAEASIARWRAAVQKPVPKVDELAGDAAHKRNDLAGALEYWKKCVAAQPQNARVLRKIARLHAAEQRWAEADAAYAAVLAVEDTGADRTRRALIRRVLHRWTEALEDNQKAQELAPDDPEVRRGAKLFQRLEQVLPEIRALDARIAVAPKDDQLLADRALLFLRAEDPELALQDSVAASELAPDAMRPRLFRAIASVELGRPDECTALGVENTVRLQSLNGAFLETLARLDADISTEPKNADLRVARAWQLNENGQPRLALEDADAALRLKERLAPAIAESSYALAKLGRPDEAFARAKEATEIEPKSAAAWQYRGELELHRGDPDAALSSLTRALELNRTAAVLEKREACYRQLGLIAKADEDRRALQELTASTAR